MNGSAVVCRNRLIVSLFMGVLLLIGGAAVSAEESTSEDWIELFNGENLDGWTPKFSRQELGVNYKNTFQVEDGILKVSYDEYETFRGEFGHLYYKDSFSHYRLVVEYRFVGEQVEGGPGWAFRNNGIMLHCQSPETLRLEQDFPVSIEVQLLGGDGENERTNANLCSPGTHVVMNDELITQHCYNSNSKTYHGDQWVTVEVEVRGNEIIRHILDGEVVLEYTEPQLDDRDGDGFRLLDAGAERMISEGYIAIQAESHPTEFRKISLLPLKEDEQEE